MGNTDKHKEKNEGSSVKSETSTEKKQEDKIKPADPDVVLDIPEVKVEQIKIKGRNLKAHVSLDARLGKMVKVNVGREAHMGSVDIEIDNVRAEVHLRVRLERVKQIFNTTERIADKNLLVLKPHLLPVTDTTGKSLGKK